MKKYIPLLALMAVPAAASAQIGYGTNNPNPHAVIDITSDNKGLLIPRMTEQQRNAIPTPPDGLMVYQTEDVMGGTTAGLYIYHTSVAAGGGGSWAKAGSGTQAITGGTIDGATITNSPISGATGSFTMAADNTLTNVVVAPTANGGTLATRPLSTLVTTPGSGLQQGTAGANGQTSIDLGGSLSRQTTINTDATNNLVVNANAIGGGNVETGQGLNVLATPGATVTKAVALRGRLSVTNQTISEARGVSGATTLTGGTISNTATGGYFNTNVSGATLNTSASVTGIAADAEATGANTLTSDNNLEGGRFGAHTTATPLARAIGVEGRADGSSKNNIGVLGATNTNDADFKNVLNALPATMNAGVVAINTPANAGDTVGKRAIYSVGNVQMVQTPAGASTDNVVTMDANGNIRQQPIANLGGLITADNGVTKTGNNVQLGGALVKPTNITTDATNTLTVTAAGIGGTSAEANQGFNVLAVAATGAPIAVANRGRMTVSTPVTEARGVSGSTFVGAGGSVGTTATGGYFNTKLSGGAMAMGSNITGVAADAEATGSNTIATGATMIGGRFGANAANATAATAVGSLNTAAGSAVANIASLSVVNDPAFTAATGLITNVAGTGNGAAVAAINPNTGANNYALYSSGNVRMDGLKNGAAADSILSTNNGNVRKVSSASLTNNIKANNGLTRTADSVQLGGTLTHNTNINTTDAATNSNLDINGGGNFTYSGTGNVGLGTAAPTNKVDVVAPGIGGTGVSAGQGLNVNATGKDNAAGRTMAIVGRMNQPAATSVADLRGVSGATTVDGSVSAGGNATGGFFASTLNAGGALGTAATLTGVAADAKTAGGTATGLNSLIGGRFGANSTTATTTAANTVGVLATAKASTTANLGVVAIANADYVDAGTPGSAANTALSNISKPVASGGSAITGAAIVAINTTTGTPTAQQRAIYSVGNVQMVQTPTGASTDNVVTMDANGNVRQQPIANLGGLITADNGLTKTGNNVQLGGDLIKPTAIGTTATNNLVINATAVGGANAEANQGLNVLASAATGTAGNKSIALRGRMNVATSVTDARGVSGTANVTGTIAATTGAVTNNTSGGYFNTQMAGGTIGAGSVAIGVNAEADGTGTGSATSTMIAGRFAANAANVSNGTRSVGALAIAEGSTTANVGVVGSTTSNPATIGGAMPANKNAGVLGVAGNAADYAGYFNGNVVSSGNVGIGQNAPANRLHITAPAAVGATPTTGQAVFVDATAAATGVSSNAVVAHLAQTSGNIQESRAVNAQTIIAGGTVATVGTTKGNASAGVFGTILTGPATLGTDATMTGVIGSAYVGNTGTTSSNTVAGGVFAATAGGATMPASSVGVLATAQSSTTNNIGVFAVANDDASFTNSGTALMAARDATTGVGGGGTAIAAINSTASTVGHQQRAIYSDGNVQMKNLNTGLPLSTATNLVGIDGNGNLSTTSANTLVSVSNGLSKETVAGPTQGDVQLGGTLTKNTTINTTNSVPATPTNNNLDINGGGNFTYSGTGKVGFGTTTLNNKVDVVANASGADYTTGQALSVNATATAGTSSNAIVGRVTSASGVGVQEIRAVNGATVINGNVTGNSIVGNASGGVFSSRLNAGGSLDAAGATLTGVIGSAFNVGGGASAANTIAGGIFSGGSLGATPANSFGILAAANNSSTNNIGVLAVANDDISLANSANAIGIASDPVAGIAGGGAAIVAINGTTDQPGVKNQRAIYASGGVQLNNLGTSNATSLVGIDGTGNLSKISGNSLVKVSNGLSKETAAGPTQGDVQLGGELSKSTTISTTNTGATPAEYNLNITGANTADLAGVFNVHNEGAAINGATLVGTKTSVADNSTDPGFRVVWGAYNSSASGNNSAQIVAGYNEAAISGAATTADDGTRAIGVVGQSHAYGIAAGTQARVVGVTGAADFAPASGASNFNAIGINGYTGDNTTGVTVGGHFDGTGGNTQFGVIGSVEGASPYEVMFDANLASKKIGIAAVNLGTTADINHLALYARGGVQMTGLSTTTATKVLGINADGLVSTAALAAPANGLTVNPDTAGFIDLGGKLYKDAVLDGTLDHKSLTIFGASVAQGGVFKVQNNLGPTDVLAQSNNAGVTSVSYDGDNGTGNQIGDITASESDAYTTSDDYQAIGSEAFATTSLTSTGAGDYIHAIGADGIAFANGTTVNQGMIVGLSGGTGFVAGNSNWSGIGVEGYLDYNNSTTGHVAAGYFNGNNRTGPTPADYTGSSYGVMGTMGDNPSTSYQSLFQSSLENQHIAVVAVNHNAPSATQLALVTDGNVRMEHISTTTPTKLLGVDANGVVGVTTGVVSPLVLSGATDLVTPVPVANNDQYEIDVTVVGATMGDVVSFGIPGAPVDGTWYTPYVFSTDHVHIRFVNRSGSAVSLTGQYKVKVLK